MSSLYSPETLKALKGRPRGWDYVKRNWFSTGQQFPLISWAIFATCLGGGIIFHHMVKDNSVVYVVSEEILTPQTRQKEANAVL